MGTHLLAKKQHNAQKEHLRKNKYKILIKSQSCPLFCMSEFLGGIDKSIISCSVGPFSNIPA